MKIIFYDDEDKILREEVFSVNDAILLETDIKDIPEWICSFMRNKIRKRTNEVVIVSGLGSRYTAVEAQKIIIEQLKTEDSPLLKSAAVKEAEEEERRNTPPEIIPPEIPEETPEETTKEV